MSTAEHSATDIDEAVSQCQAYIEEQRRAARRVLMLLGQIGVVVVGLLASFVVTIIYPAFREMAPAVDPAISSTVIFATLGIFTLVFSVTMSIYRFHLNEISKSEHYKMGFTRIRVAAHNTKKGFQTEVRQALTEYAFVAPYPKGSTVKSPVPGHPASDLGAVALSKIIEGLEVRSSSKDRKRTNET